MGTTQSSPGNDSYPPELLGEEGVEEVQVKKRSKPSIDVSLLPEGLTSKYEVVDKIGSGSFGAVYKVRDRKTMVVYAAKYVENKESNVSEVEIQAKMDDLNVVKIYDTVILPTVKRMVIIMEYCEGGNLLQWIQRNRKHQLLNETIILKMFRELCAAVYNCHQKRIIHRDLKPENVLLDSKRRIKLADFGVARILHRESVAKSFCGTPPYMAPELFISYLARGGQGEGNLGYDCKCDVWSIGCILWDMANTSNIFLHQLSNTVGLSVAQTSESIGSKEIQDLVEKDVPNEYVLTKRLLRGMLKKDADQRLSLYDILQDSELIDALQNPLDGHWSDIL